MKFSSSNSPCAISLRTGSTSNTSLAAPITDVFSLKARARAISSTTAPLDMLTSTEPSFIDPSSASPMRRVSCRVWGSAPRGSCDVHRVDGEVGEKTWMVHPKACYGYQLGTRTTDH
jgi:hypothetical protein